LRGQLLLIVLVAAVVYVILGPIMGLRYALAIGILTGILEIIPLVGPILAAGIAAVDAVAQGGLSTAAVVIVIYTVLRQIEDQLVAPVVIGRAVHLHPIVTIFAVLIGLEVYGVLGGLLGVPAAAAINVVFRALYPQGVEAVEETFAGAVPADRSPPTDDARGAPVGEPLAADGASATLTEPADEQTRATD
jgi:predicted PurR-regulated permease PerM